MFVGQTNCLEEVVHLPLQVFPSVCTVGVMSTVAVVVNSVGTRVPWTVLQEPRELVSLTDRVFRTSSTGV